MGLAGLGFQALEPMVQWPSLPCLKIMALTAAVAVTPTEKPDDIRLDSPQMTAKRTENSDFLKCMQKMIRLWKDQLLWSLEPAFVFFKADSSSPSSVLDNFRKNGDSVAL